MHIFDKELGRRCQKMQTVTQAKNETAISLAERTELANQPVFSSLVLAAAGFAEFPHRLPEPALEHPFEIAIGIERA